MSDAENNRSDRVADGGWCAPSWSPCPKCGEVFCECFARPVHVLECAETSCVGGCLIPLPEVPR